MKRPFRDWRNLLVLAGLFLALIGAVDIWIDRDLSKSLRGIQWPVAGEVPVIPRWEAGSFGVAVAIAALVSLVFCLRWSRTQSTLFGILILAIVLAVPFQLAFGDATRLRDLLQDNRDSYGISQFNDMASETDLNYGRIPSMSMIRTPVSLLERLEVSIYFLGRGWHVALAGALIVIGVGLASMERAPRRLFAGVTGALFAIALILCLLRPFIGLHHLERALAAQAAGELDRAASHYRAAMQWDSWNKTNFDLHRRLGELDALKGQRSTPEFHLLMGSIEEQAEDWDGALYHFRVAAESPDLTDIATEHAAELSLQRGKTLQIMGALSGALLSWREAHRLDPGNPQAIFLIGWGCVKTGEHAQGLEWLQRFVSITFGDATYADAYSLMADASEKLGRSEEARRYYLISLKHDKVMNTRAFGAVAGR